MQNFYNQMAGMENDAAIVQAQNSFISKVFGWMTVGLAVTGVVAYYVSTQRELVDYEKLFNKLNINGKP